MRRLTALTILAITWPPATAAAENSHWPDIRQVDHTIRATVVKTVNRPAFVLGTFPPLQPLAPPAPPQRTAINLLPSLSIRVAGEQPLRGADPVPARPACIMPTVYFELGSATALDLADTISALRTCGVTTTTPLLVIGHACDLGPEEFNRELSRQRAETVAALLATYGFTRISVIALGDTSSVTADPDQRHLNRRVEIKQEEN